MPPPTPDSPSWFWYRNQRTGMETAPWDEALWQDALCCHLNFHGEGRLILTTGQSVTLKPQTLGWCQGACNAKRIQSRGHHECLTLIYPNPWLAASMGEVIPQITENTRRLVSLPFPTLFLAGRTLRAEDERWSRSLTTASLSDAARRLLDTARLTDFLLRELFALDGSKHNAAPISRSQRAASERVERVKAYISQHLDEPPNLDALAAAAGCSPYYLSRTFAQVTGVPLILWIRRARIERAAELIANGRCNVSEAAMEVGYSSFSHFSHAFHEEKGVPPSQWIRHLAENRSR